MLYGGVHRLPDRLRVTAQLTTAKPAPRYGPTRSTWRGPSPVRVQEDIAGRIYHSVAGLDSYIRASEQRAAWQKSPMALDEYDYYLRGTPVPPPLNRGGFAESAGDQREGLDAIRIGSFEDQARLHSSLRGDEQRQRRSQGRHRAGVALPRGGFGERHAVPLRGMACALAQGFPAPVAGQRFHPIRRRGPCGGRARAQQFACAGATLHGFSPTPGSATKPRRGRGREQCESCVEYPPLWLHSNLAWANYVAGRYREALEALRGLSDDFFAMRVAAQVRLGEAEAAHAAVADYVKRGGQDTIANEARYPQIEPIGHNISTLCGRLDFPTHNRRRADVLPPSRSLAVVAAICRLTIAIDEDGGRANSSEDHQEKPRQYERSPGRNSDADGPRPLRRK